MGQQLETPSSSSKHPPCDPPHIEYRLDPQVSSSHKGLLRYAAYHRVMQNDQCDPSMMVPLTIEGWTNYMLGDNANRLSMELTNLIKVRSLMLTI